MQGIRVNAERLLQLAEVFACYCALVLPAMQEREDGYHMPLRINAEQNLIVAYTSLVDGPGERITDFACDNGEGRVGSQVMQCKLESIQKPLCGARRAENVCDVSDGCVKTSAGTRRDDNVKVHILLESRPKQFAHQPRLRALRMHSLRESWPFLLRSGEVRSTARNLLCSSRRNLADRLSLQGTAPLPLHRHWLAAPVRTVQESRGPWRSPFANLRQVYAAEDAFDARRGLLVCPACTSRGCAASDGSLDRGSCPGFARLGGIWASLYGFYRSACDHGFVGTSFTCGFDAGGCLLPARRAGRGRQIYTGNGVLPRFAETPVTAPRCLLFADACVHGVCRSARKNALVERRLAWCGGWRLLGQSAHLRFCRCQRASWRLAFVWAPRRRSTSAFFGPERETPRIGPPPASPSRPASRSRTPRRPAARAPRAPRSPHVPHPPLPATLGPSHERHRHPEAHPGALRRRA